MIRDPSYADYSVTPLQEKFEINKQQKRDVARTFLNTKHKKKIFEGEENPSLKETITKLEKCLEVIGAKVSKEPCTEEQLAISLMSLLIAKQKELIAEFEKEKIDEVWGSCSCPMKNA